MRSRRSHSLWRGYCWTIGFLTTGCLIACAENASKPAPVLTSVVGLVANTHAVRHPTPGGFGDTLVLNFVRFLEDELVDRELPINYAYEWITAMPQDFGRGRDLLGRQSLTFPTPTSEDRQLGYQLRTVRLKVADQGDRRPGSTGLSGQQLRVKVLPSSSGTYMVVDERGRLIRELNRRWAEQSALCRIYEGCVIACLPQGQSSATECHPVDERDLDQYVPNCYLIAALVAAVRRDPAQVLSLISLQADGYVVSFPGQLPIQVPQDLDRGPDMIESRALDVDQHGNVEIWPALLERAFAILNSRMRPKCSGPGQEFLDVSDGDSQQAYHILTGRPVVESTRWKYSCRLEHLQAIKQHLVTGPVMMATGKWTDSGDRPYWWLEDHVYVVTAVGANDNSLTVIDPNCGQMVERIKIGDWFDSAEVKRFLLCK